jgi:dienelactone hydrolase
MDLSYDFGGRSHVGHLARPAKSGRRPGILVIHGGGGLGSHARERADRLAQQGYMALAADLFGHPVDGFEHAQALTRALTEDWQDMRARASTALDVLRRQDGVDRDRLAAIGFCFGGQVAIELARSGAGLRAVVGFHSELGTKRPQDTTQIRGKVLVCLGDRDRFVAAADRECFLDEMASAGIDCQMLLFAGVQHSFTDRHAEASGVQGLKYDAAADRRSWAAMHALFCEVFA